MVKILAKSRNKTVSVTAFENTTEDGRVFKSISVQNGFLPRDQRNLPAGQQKWVNSSIRLFDNQLEGLIGCLKEVKSKLDEEKEA